MYPLKALIIDDEPVVLATLQHLLQHRGYEVLAYDNPVNTPLYNITGCPCSLHDSKCPDVIISDVDMPIMNGLALLESVMTMGCRCRHLALISGKGIAEEDYIRPAKYGTRFFLKPIDFYDFFSWLDHVEHDVAIYSAA